MSYSLTWQGLHILFSICCTAEEKQWISGTDGTHVDVVLAHNPNNNVYQVGGCSSPHQDPGWNSQKGNEDLERRDGLLYGLLLVVSNEEMYKKAC